MMGIEARSGQPWQIISASPSVKPLRSDDRLGAGKPVDKAIPGRLTGENLDFHAQVVDGDFRIEDPWDTDSILFCRNDGIELAAAALADEAFDFAGGIAMVIGVDFGELDLNVERPEGIFKAVRYGDPAERANPESSKKVERLALSGRKIAQVFRSVGTFDDIGCPVVFADAGDDVAIVSPIALGEEYMSGAAEVARRLTQRATRQHVIVAEGSLPVDQNNFEPMAHPDVLQPVIENQRVGIKMADRVDPALDAVAIDKDNDPSKVVC